MNTRSTLLIVALLLTLTDSSACKIKALHNIVITEYEKPELGKPYYLDFTIETARNHKYKTPLISNNNLVAAIDAFVCSIDLKTKNTNWIIPYDPSGGVHSVEFIHSDQTVVIDHRDRLEGVRLIDGVTIWSVPAKFVEIRTEAPLKSGSHTFGYSTFSNELVIRSIETGVILWHHESLEPREQIIAILGDSVVIYAEEMYVDSLKDYSSTLCGYNILTKQHKWRSKTLYPEKEGANIRFMYHSAHVDTILAAVNHVSCYGINMNTGKFMWENYDMLKTPNGSLGEISHGVFAAEDHFYAANNAGQIFKIDPLTGTTMWKNDTPGKYSWLGNKISESNSIASAVLGILYVFDAETGSFIQALKPKRSAKWGGDVFHGGTVMNDDYIFVDGSFYLHAFKCTE